MDFANVAKEIFNYLLLIFGFGFVIFFHELGHFLAAKYAGVKVEQFAVGFGPAILAWRKGIGARRGSTTSEYNRRVSEHIEAHATKFQETAQITPAQEYAAATKMGLGETEYRLNWFPLGGYVKMLGQDDLRPGVTADDPRSYNSKPIRSRMLIVSAGVIMNVILAAVTYMVVYLMGYPCPPAIAGSIASNSPAILATNAKHELAPLQEGDEILSFNGNRMYKDFSRLATNVALTEQGATVRMEVLRRNGLTEVLDVKPQRSELTERLQTIGLMSPAVGLEGEVVTGQADFARKTKEFNKEKDKDQDLRPDETFAIKPGDVITQINGQDVKVNETWKLDEAMAKSEGKPIKLTVQGFDAATTRPVLVTPHFQEAFDDNSFNLMGLVPRAELMTVQDDSPAEGKIKPGDVITSVTLGDNAQYIQDPSKPALTKLLWNAGDNGIPVKFTVLGPDGTIRTIDAITPTVKLGHGRKGLGVGLHYDEQHLVIAEVKKDSTASNQLQPSDRIIKINDIEVDNWFQLRNAMLGSLATTGTARKIQPIHFTVKRGGEVLDVTLTPSQADIDYARGITFSHDLLQLDVLPNEMKTSNPLEAMKMGLIATHDLILQFYLTLQRMVTGEVPARALMGPVGMLGAGVTFAGRGTAWLLWFLAMISANLAVVNFLPIPIVDGGLFAFLILEKVQGRPLSPNAQKVIQTAGLVLILGIFLLVTYSDLARMLFNN